MSVNTMTKLCQFLSYDETKNIVLVMYNLLPLLINFNYIQGL